MVYGCGNNMIKFLVFITNLLIFVFGGLIFGFSLWANLDQNFTDHLEEAFKKASLDLSYVELLQQYQASLWILVAVGALLCLVGFLGCCGAACESLFFLTLYFIVILVLFFIQLFTIVYLKMNKDGFLTDLYQILKSSAQTPALRQNLKPVESLVKCCGATIESAALYAEDCKQLGVFGQPDCFTAISHQLDSMSNVIEPVAITLLIVQAFALIFSCVLNRAIRERTPAYY